MNSFSVNIVKENAHGVGLWGGECVCPDGNSYQVGTDLTDLAMVRNTDPVDYGQGGYGGWKDGTDSCLKLACINGQMVSCNKHQGPWSKRKVTCGVSQSQTTGIMTTMALCNEITIWRYFKIVDLVNFFYRSLVFL